MLGADVAAARQLELPTTSDRLSGVCEKMRLTRCHHCHSESPRGAKFCSDCGARLARICPHCRAEVSSGKRFCWSCGGQLTDPDTDRVPPPVAYTPDHLAERILTSKTA